MAIPAIEVHGNGGMAFIAELFLAFVALHTAERAAGDFSVREQVGFLPIRFHRQDDVQGELLRPLEEGRFVLAANVSHQCGHRGSRVVGLEPDADLLSRHGA